MVYYKPRFNLEDRFRGPNKNPQSIGELIKSMYGSDGSLVTSQAQIDPVKRNVYGLPITKKPSQQYVYNKFKGSLPLFEEALRNKERETSELENKTFEIEFYKYALGFVYLGAVTKNVPIKDIEIGVIHKTESPYFMDKKMREGIEFDYSIQNTPKNLTPSISNEQCMKIYNTRRRLAEQKEKANQIESIRDIFAKKFSPNIDYTLIVKNNITILREIGIDF